MLAFQVWFHSKKCDIESKGLNFKDKITFAKRVTSKKVQKIELFPKPEKVRPLKKMWRFSDQKCDIKIWEFEITLTGFVLWLGIYDHLAPTVFQPQLT